MSRRSYAGVKKTLKQTHNKNSSSEYASLHGFLGGPVVQVVVGSHRQQLYTIPKKFLCHNSEYFRGMFDAGMKETHELKTSLDLFEPETFEQIIQWIGTGEVNLPPLEFDDMEALRMEFWKHNEKTLAGHLGENDELKSSASVREKVDTIIKGEEGFRLELCQYFEFLIAADFLMIRLDPTEEILEKMRCVVKDLLFHEPIDLIKHDMVAKIFELPTAHPARKFIADICAHGYCKFKLTPNYFPCKTFPYVEDMESVPGFASQLLDSFAETMRNMESVYIPDDRVIVNTISTAVWLEKLVISSQF